MQDNIDNIKFVVIDIVTERNPMGSSEIYFKVVNNETIPLMRVKVKNFCINDKNCVRELMLYKYFDELEKKNKEAIRVGDVI